MIGTQNVVKLARHPGAESRAHLLSYGAPHWKERDYSLYLQDSAPNSAPFKRNMLGATIVRVVEGKIVVSATVPRIEMVQHTLEPDQWLHLPHGGLEITNAGNTPARYLLLTTYEQPEPRSMDRSRVTMGTIDFKAAPIYKSGGIRAYPVGPQLTKDLRFETVRCTGRLPRHRHPETSNILVFLSGHPVLAKENDADQIDVTRLEGGSFVQIPPNNAHGAYGNCTFDSIQLGAGNAGEGTMPEPLDYDYDSYHTSRVMQLVAA